MGDSLGLRSRLVMDEDDFDRLKIRPRVSLVDNISACPTDGDNPDVKWRRLRGLDSRYKCSRIIGSGSFGKVTECSPPCRRFAMHEKKKQKKVFKAFVVYTF